MNWEVEMVFDAKIKVDTGQSSDKEKISILRQETLEIKSKMVISKCLADDLQDANDDF